MQRNFTYVDIFSGCGGMSLGLHNSGWKGLFAIEKNAMAFETLKFNLIDKKNHFDWPEWLEKKEYDINEFLENYKQDLENLNGKVELVVGGPPCQGFSLAGRRIENDNRNMLVKSYIKFIRAVMPKVLVFENVRGFSVGFKISNSNKRGVAYSDIVKEELENLGYNVEGVLVDFSKFGVPQKRMRYIIIGTLKGEAKDIFKALEEYREEFYKKKKLPFREITLSDAIGDLFKENGTSISKEFPRFEEGEYSDRFSKYQFLMRKWTRSPDSHRFANHSIKTEENFSLILKTCKNSKINEEIRKKLNTKKHTINVLNSEKPSPTLTTLPDDYIHYKEPRILTVREYARIQSFPDWFKFRGKYTTGGINRKNEVPRYTQVGNAVPPLFAEALGDIVMKFLSERIDIAQEEYETQTITKGEKV